MKTKTLMTLAAATTLLSGLSPANAGTIHSFESDGNGFNTKSYFYDTGTEVVAFDTQFTPELARKSIEALRSRTSNPITYVVVTHPNPDKFNGMSVFQELGAKVVASKATANAMPGVHDYKKYFFVKIAKMFSEETYPKLSKPDLVFDKTLDLKLSNGERIRLRELSGPGVSSNQTIAYIPKADAVIVGDLVHHEAHAWLEGGIVAGKPVPTIKGWIKDLLELRKLFASQPNVKVYGGRGRVASLDVAVKAQVEYLRKADSLVESYVAKLGAARSELLSDKAAGHHQALQAEFEKAFPSYGLGYMVQYGVYGLANSKL